MSPAHSDHGDPVSTHFHTGYLDQSGRFDLANHFPEVLFQPLIERTADYATPIVHTEDEDASVGV